MNEVLFKNVAEILKLSLREENPSLVDTARSHLQPGGSSFFISQAKLGHFITGIEHFITGREHLIIGWDHFIIGWENFIIGWDHFIIGKEHLMKVKNISDYFLIFRHETGSWKLVVSLGLLLAPLSIAMSRSVKNVVFWKLNKWLD